MPQIEQLPYIYASQIFWLLVVFGILFFAIGRGMVPKIMSTVQARESKIADDLAQAQRAREAAEQTEAEYRARMDASRAEAARLAQEAKQASARENDVRVRAAAQQVASRTEAAEARIRDAVAASRTEVEKVAVEATQQLVARLIGAEVDRTAAERAVKAELHV